MKQSFPRAKHREFNKLPNREFKPIGRGSFCVFCGTLWLALLLVCSCAKLPRHISDGSPAITTDVKAQTKRVNINVASAAELESLPGVGKVLAGRIVSHRQQYGSFRRVEHLMMVRGFSDNKFRKIRDLVTAS